MEISTHALTEGDKSVPDPIVTEIYFNTRPHGGRHLVLMPHLMILVFQLTPSRRATFLHHKSINNCYISTHALTEGDGIRPA